MYFIPPILIFFLPPQAGRDEPEADVGTFKLVQY
jgi:hypothetical protein